jgi:hypothetical protein
MVTGWVGSGGKADCVVGTNKVICCAARPGEEYIIVDGVPALLKVTYNGEMEVKVLYSVLSDYWMISIESRATNAGCLQNPIEKWILIAFGYKLCIKVVSILIGHIHTHLVMVVHINNDRYIKLSLAFSRKNCGVCSTCIGTLVAWMLSHSQHQ